MQIFYADMQSFRYCLVQILHGCRSVLSFSKSVDTHTQLLCKFYREEPDGHTLQMLRQFYTVLRSTNALFIHIFHPSYHLPFSFFCMLCQILALVLNLISSFDLVPLSSFIVSLCLFYFLHRLLFYISCASLCL